MHHQRRTGARPVGRSRARRTPAPLSPENLNPENTMSDKSQTTEDTHQDLKELLHEAEQALSHTAGEAGEKFEELRERLRAALDKGRYSLDSIRAETVRRAKQADTLIRENPYYAIGVAAGVGAVIGILVSRSCQQSR
jgi:ElaB/YqjD/DUF883 family membrane-anchored ribosome-binding protein